MYVIEEFNGVLSPRVVRMSFELPYLDWCRFERSDVFHQLTEYLEGLKKQKKKKVNKKPIKYISHKNKLVLIKDEEAGPGYAGGIFLNGQALHKVLELTYNRASAFDYTEAVIKIYVDELIEKEK